MKNENIPTLVDSEEEIDSSDTEDENEEHNHDNLKQDHNKTSDEISYSIDIYVTDARILTEIENILRNNKITCQNYEVNNKFHLNLIKFKTHTNKKPELFKALKTGIEEIVSFNLVTRGINKMEESDEIYVRVVDNHGLSKIRRTLTEILDKFKIQYDKKFVPRIEIKGQCKETIEDSKKRQFLGEQIVKRIHISERENQETLDCFELIPIPQSILIGEETHEKIARSKEIQLIGKMIEPLTMKLIYALLESNTINLDRCQDCKKCTSCSPYIIYNNENKIIIKRNDEQDIIHDCIRFEKDENKNISIITKLPADTNDLSKILGKTNEVEVKEANDKKMKLLNERQKKDIYQEFLKMKKAGYIVHINELSKEEQ